MTLVILLGPLFVGCCLVLGDVCFMRKIHRGHFSTFVEAFAP